MNSQPERMDVSVLTQACQRESGKFFRDQPTDDSFCYELFRRALKYKNQYAWEGIWATYRNLVSGWIRGYSGFEQTNTPLEELVTLSFEKFWFAFSNKSIDHFPTLPALLQYLRLCCASTVTDRLRRRKRDRYLTDIDEAYYLASDQKPDNQVVEEEERNLFWYKIQDLLNDEQEKLLISSYFILGFKPRHIHNKYPEAFPTVQDVYRVKRNVMNRLRRAEDLKEYWHS